MTIQKQVSELLKRAEQRIVDFVLECSIARERRLMLASYFDAGRSKHWLAMKELIRLRSPGQIKRMERKLGLRGNE